MNFGKLSRAGGILAIMLAAPVALGAGPTIPATAADSLLAAVRAGDARAVTTWLVAGAPPETRDADYYDATALMLAAERDDPAVGRALLAHGADPDARDKSGDTALNWAAYYGYLATTEMLLAAGADPSLAGHGNALDVARRRGHEALLLPLAEHLGRTRPVAPLDQSVFAAIAAADPTALHAALAAGGHVTARDRVGRTPLQRAAGVGEEAVVGQLLAAGAVVDAADPIGFTPLMVAARGAHTAVARQLLAAGADPALPALPSGLSLTPLHLAAIGGDDELIAVLLVDGVDIDPVGAAGNTPAMWALAEGHLATVQRLLAAGADPDRANEDGDSVRSIAEQWNIQDLLAVLNR